MRTRSRSHSIGAGSAVLAFMLLAALPAIGHLDLGSEEFVQAGGLDIDVPGYSVPSFVDWNEDGLEDLVVGEGSGTVTPKVRIYLNSGTVAAPEFSTYFYAQSNGGDLSVPGGG